ncbi:MAG: hypothetical protein LUG16_05135 [Candidatus Gastranaerophilales bacterium]|nr:hypothetical protein [Candidatus Gastranaerophilales bacterium]
MAPVDGLMQFGTNIYSGNSGSGTSVNNVQNQSLSGVSNASVSKPFDYHSLDKYDTSINQSDTFVSSRNTMPVSGQGYSEYGINGQESSTNIFGFDTDEFEVNNENSSYLDNPAILNLYSGGTDNMDVSSVDSVAPVSSNLEGYNLGCPNRTSFEQGNERATLLDYVY